MSKLQIVLSKSQLEDSMFQRALVSQLVTRLSEPRRFIQSKKRQS